MNKITLIVLGFLFVGSLYLYWADKRDEELMKRWDKCVYVVATNGVAYCTDK